MIRKITSNNSRKIETKNICNCFQVDRRQREKEEKTPIVNTRENVEFLATQKSHYVNTQNIAA